MAEYAWGGKPVPVSTWKPQPLSMLSAAPPPKKAVRPRKKKVKKVEVVEE